MGVTLFHVLVAYQFVDALAQVPGVASVGSVGVDLRPASRAASDSRAVAQKAKDDNKAQHSTLAR